MHETLKTVEIKLSVKLKFQSFNFTKSFKKSLAISLILLGFKIVFLYLKIHGQ